jgi:predicted RNase H-like HicB family nuclease
VYQITLEIQKLDEGPYLGTSPELPGLIVQGASPEEVVELAPDIARELIEVMLETGGRYLRLCARWRPRPASRSSFLRDLR